MRDIFIGVDGGGTKSKVRIEDSEHGLLGQAVTGAGCIRISVSETWRVIYEAIEEILHPQEIYLHDKNNRFHIGLGLSGCEVKEAYDDFSQCPHPFTTFILKSDAHVACLGAHHGADGAIIIVGTGVVGYEIDDGNYSRVGGWGFPYDDEGGGAWLGLEAAKLTFQWLDHRVEKSPLVLDVFDFFERDIDKLVTWASRANSTEFARLAPFVINHAQQEEIAALRILKKAAQAVDRVGHTLMKLHTHKQPVLSCCLYGGIAPFLEPYLSADLRATLVPRQADASEGAILMVRNALIG